MNEVDYNRMAALAYTKDWAHGRNPKYLDFSMLGGDCTNFASQCLYAGIPLMNYTPDLGWFYLNSYHRAAAWTSAQYFQNFLLNNIGRGPYARTCSQNELMPGDFISLKLGEPYYSHTLIVTAISPVLTVAAHTYDAYNKPFELYDYADAVFLHILGGRK